MESEYRWKISISARPKQLHVARWQLVVKKWANEKNFLFLSMAISQFSKPTHVDNDDDELERREGN